MALALARELARPPDVIDFARLLDFSRSTYDDDRSLIAVWGPVAVSALVDVAAGLERRALGVEEFGDLVPISRFGGQGRVYRPAVVPAGLGAEPVVVKLYRRAPPAGAGRVLSEMVAWGHLLSADQRGELQRVAAWPLAIVRPAARSPPGS